MAIFRIGEPVTTETAAVVVDAGLRVGFHRFRLVVVDDAGQTSQPDEALVQVNERIVVPVDVTPTPTLAPIIRPTSPIGPVVSPTILTPLRPRRRTR